MINKKRLVFNSLLSMSMLVVSCISNDVGITPQEQLRLDIASIDQFLNNEGLTPIKDPSGVRMVIDTLGKDLPASVTTSVKVRYKGWFLNDSTVFDQGIIEGLPNRFITGWQVALTTLPEGSHATVFIPSGYAYGTDAKPKIPANSILVFSMTVIDVTRTPEYYSKIVSDSIAIDKFLVDKGVTNAIKDSTGIRYVIREAGDGPVATWYDKLTITKYKTTFLDGTVIYESPTTLAPSETFYSRPVDYVIDGLKIGLRKMRKGSKYTFYFPSGYAYGSASSNQSVPANTNIILEVDVADISPNK